MDCSCMFLVLVPGVDIIAHLLGYILTVIVWNLLESFLLNISTCVVWIVLACSLYGCPHLVVPCPLPLVLTVLLVLCLALRLCVVLSLVPVLLAALLLVLCLAHRLVHRLALLPLPGDTLLLVGGVTLLDLYCLAVLCLRLNILSVPHLCILSPTGHLTT